MSGENRIDYIEMPARDPAVAKRFFTELFGWTFEDYGPDYVSFSDGRLAGGFRRMDAECDSGSGSVLVVFYKNDLEATKIRVEALGGQITRDIFSFPGGSRFHFRDPHDNDRKLTWTRVGQRDDPGLRGVTACTKKSAIPAYSTSCR
jgi:uncharacterized protein